MTDVTTIPVGGPSPYDVVVGHDLTAQVPALLPQATRVLVVADERVRDRAETVRAALTGSGMEASVTVVPSGERAKSLEVVASLWDEAGRRRMTRNDAVVGVGGGAVTDVAGFAAATWLRGVSIVHVPTTLLGMVDAAVGGKTAINTRACKNLVGAFHAPAGVIVDLDVLDTLPAAEWVNGMAEVVKAGFIADPAILDAVERSPADAADPRSGAARQLIERAIRVKADVVSADSHETGLREILNYGHTLAHAVERVEDYGIPHGHAVSIGMVFVAALSRLAGRLDADTAARHTTTLAAIGLPTLYGRHTFDELLEVMRVDKKARGATLRFVVLDALAKPSLLEGPDEQLLRAAFDEVVAR
jgi:3-dehydroquinate synthase